MVRTASRYSLSKPALRIGAKRAPGRPAPVAPTPTTAAAPVIKWVGGKSKLVDELSKRMPTDFARYYEPFAGGLALYLRVVAPMAKRAVIGDGNADLINLYQTLASDVESLVRRLEIHRKHHDKDHYYDTRERWNNTAVSWTAIDRAAAFIYLNKTCFNGLWRVNRAGHFNVPMGRYNDPPICAPEQLRTAAQALRGCQFRIGDYRATVADAKAGDFVYFDPPYDPVASTANFTSYTQNGFSAENQAELADLARSLVARGCRVMLSNSDTPLIRSLYRGFQIDTVQCARAINSDASKRGNVSEIVATAGYASAKAAA